MTKRVAWLVALLLSLSTSGARADAVDACPPGYAPSHAGCQFDPQPHDLVYVACCCGAPLVLAAVAGLVLSRRKKAQRPDA